MQGPMGGGGFREGGPTSYRKGFLKRRLPAIYLARFSSTAGEAGEFNARVIITGLSQNLFYLIGVCAVGEDATQPPEPEINIDKLGIYPVNPGDMQITPFTDPPTTPRQVWRPIFQDPTATDNKNNPLPQDIPFGWMIDGDDADGAYVDVHIEADAWTAGEGVDGYNGSLIFQLVIAYDGSWWDSTALEKAIAMVNIRPDVNGQRVIITEAL